MEKGQCEQCLATTDLMIQLRKFIRGMKVHNILVYQGWNTEMMEVNNSNNK